MLTNLNKTYATLRAHCIKITSNMATITKRGDSWFAQVRRTGHKSISKSFRTKGMAQTWAREVEQQIDSMQFKDARGLSHIKLCVLIDRYTEEIGSIKQFGRSKADVLRRLRLILGEVPLSELTGDRVTDYVRDRSRTAGGVTIATELTYLAGVLKTAKELWRLPVDTTVSAAARASLKYMGISTKSKERDRRPTQKEIDDLYIHFTVNPYQRVPAGEIILFAVETAMRLGEIMRIKWADINHADKTITIRDRKHPTQKTGNDQEVPLLGDAYTIMMRQPKTDERIFPFLGDTVSSIFPRACKALGIVDLRFHDLRHEGVSRLFEQGYTIEQVSLVSGHRDWKMLARYVQLRAKDLHR